MKCVVPQIYKAINLAIYNIICRYQRLWLSPRHHWFSYFARQLRTLCRVKYLSNSPCRYCESWREYALSWMPRALVTYIMMMECALKQTARLCIHVRFLQDFIVWPKCPVTETSRPNRPDRIVQTETSQTETARPKSPVPFEIILEWELVYAYRLLQKTFNLIKNDYL